MKILKLIKRFFRIKEKDRKHQSNGFYEFINNEADNLGNRPKEE